jgi:hypothetical protein
MSVDVFTREKITRWVLDLSRLVRVNSEDGDDDDQLLLYTRMLELEPFPAGAYCDTSLHHVTRDRRWWPEFAELRLLLAEWWRDNAPAAAPRLAYDGETGLNAWDQSWLDFYHREKAKKTPRPTKDHLESLLRRYAPNAYKLVAASHPPHPAFDPNVPPQEESFG